MSPRIRARAFSSALGGNWHPSELQICLYEQIRSRDAFWTGTMRRASAACPPPFLSLGAAVRAASINCDLILAQLLHGATRNPEEDILGSNRSEVFHLVAAALL